MSEKERIELEKKRTEKLTSFKREKRLKKERAVRESICSHKEKADKLRKGNELGIAIRDAKRWAKKNPEAVKNIKIGSGVAAGTLATAGLAYGGKKAYDHYKNKKKEN